MFNEIKYNNDPELIGSISEFRHYINVWGITDELIDYMCFEEDEEPNEVCSYMYDNIFGGDSFSDYLDKESRNKFIESHKLKMDNIEAAKRRNQDLVDKFERQKTTFFNNMGIRKAKLFLNKRIKENDEIALMYRLALEAETQNVRAKDCQRDFKDKVYAEKEKYIKQLIEVCDRNKVKYGVADSDAPAASHVVYFELPNMRQISFHSNLDVAKLPNYNDEWDGIINSTTDKIEEAMIKTYSIAS